MLKIAVSNAYDLLLAAINTAMPLTAALTRDEATQNAAQKVFSEMLSLNQQLISLLTEEQPNTDETTFLDDAIDALSEDKYTALITGWHKLYETFNLLGLPENSNSYLNGKSYCQDSALFYHEIAARKVRLEQKKDTPASLMKEINHLEKLTGHTDAEQHTNHLRLAHHYLCLNQYFLTEEESNNAHLIERAFEHDLMALKCAKKFDVFPVEVSLRGIDQVARRVNKLVNDGSLIYYQALVLQYLNLTDHYEQLINACQMSDNIRRSTYIEYFTTQKLCSEQCAYRGFLDIAQCQKRLADQVSCREEKKKLLYDAINSLVRITQNADFETHDDANNLMTTCKKALSELITTPALQSTALVNMQLQAAQQPHEEKPCTEEGMEIERLEIKNMQPDLPSVYSSSIFTDNRQSWVAHLNMDVSMYQEEATSSSSSKHSI